MPGIYDPDDPELPSAEPHDLRDDNEPVPEADDREHRVVHRPNPLPSREEDEEELAEADILEYLDLEYPGDGDRLDRDDLDRMEGPDA
ncbi:MAG TPA: hypothetical protein VF469_28720 [Kofleriaceae bacterium]